MMFTRNYTNDDVLDSSPRQNPIQYKFYGMKN